MNNIIKTVIAFVKSHETLMEILLFIAKRFFGAEVIDETIKFVQETSLQVIAGKAKYDIVKAKLQSSITPANNNYKDTNYLLDTMIQVVVAYMKYTKKIQ